MYNFIKFKSNEAISPLAPNYDYNVIESIITDVDFDEVARVILEKESIILRDYSHSNKENVDGFTGLGADSLTSRYQYFNVFSWDNPEIHKILRHVKRVHDKFVEVVDIKEPEDLVIQCWANVLRGGQKMTPHLHSCDEWTYLSGHITVKSEDTCTVYIDPINQINNPNEYKSYNESGKITLFQSNIPHYTTEYNGSSERITIAFDIILKDNPSLNQSNNVLQFK
jgi:hypothetical protein